MYIILYVHNIYIDRYVHVLSFSKLTLKYLKIFAYMLLIYKGM